MKTVIRVYLTKPKERRGTPQMGIFLECLRYMGVIKLDDEEDDKWTIWIYPPKDIIKASHRHWAESNVQRMRTFGVTASVEQLIN